ncbi:alpha/beta hydrolase, partial [Rhizobium ruizarguesonis]
HRPNKISQHVANPLCGFNASVYLWLDLFELTFHTPQKLPLDRLPRDLPIHPVGGEEDSATERGRAVLWLSNHLNGRGFS